MFVFSFAVSPQSGEVILCFGCQEKSSLGSDVVKFVTVDDFVFALNESDVEMLDGKVIEWSNQLAAPQIK